jgi:Ala-tRNA(Pro) deacylase
MSDSKKEIASNIYDVLKMLGINFTVFEHPAVFTTNESSQYEIDPQAARCKNLFLRNKKKSQYYLIIMESQHRASMDQMASLLGEKSLCFASEEDLMTYLKVMSGSVSPFALINNLEKNVIVVLDPRVLNYEKVGFHPNINTSTLVLASSDFEKFLEWTKNQIIFLQLGAKD